MFSASSAGRRSTLLQRLPSFLMRKTKQSSNQSEQLCRGRTSPQSFRDGRQIRSALDLLGPLIQASKRTSHGQKRKMASFSANKPHWVTSGLSLRRCYLAGRTMMSRTVGTTSSIVRLDSCSPPGKNFSVARNLPVSVARKINMSIDDELCSCQSSIGAVLSKPLPPTLGLLTYIHT